MIVSLHMESQYGVVPAVLSTLSEEGQKMQACMNTPVQAGKKPRVYAYSEYCAPLERAMKMTFEQLRQYITK